MRTIRHAFPLAVGLSFTVGAAPRDPVGDLWIRVIDGVRVRTIDIDLTDPRVRVGIETARGFPHASESFGAFVARSAPVVAIDGAYFSKATFAPIGDIVTHGRLVYARASKRLSHAARHSGWIGASTSIRPPSGFAIRISFAPRTERELPCGSAAGSRSSKAKIP